MSSSTAKGYGKGKLSAPPPPPPSKAPAQPKYGLTQKQEMENEISIAKKMARATLRQRIDQLNKRHREQEEYVRKTTKIDGPHAEKLRQAYKHEDEILNWYPSVRDLTFETEFLQLSPIEKCAILYDFFYGDERYCEWHKFMPDNEQLRQLFQHFWPGANLEKCQTVLEQLEQSVHNVIVRKFNHCGVFVKLYTSSPKDAPRNFLLAKANYIQKTSNELSYDERWVLFYTESIRANKVLNGREVIQLLTSSKKVALDLLSDLSDLKDYPAEDMGVGLAIRAYDPAVTPAHEFRGFVWDGQLTAVTQTLCYIVQEVLENEAHIQQEVNEFFQNRVKHRIFLEAGVFGGPLRDANQLPRHFTMDLLWDPAKPRGQQITLIEINPFEGEDWSVYKDSTGLYTLKTSWDVEEKVDLDSFKLKIDPRDAFVTLPVQNMYGEDFNAIFGFRQFETQDRRQPTDPDFVDFRFTHESPSRKDVFSAYMNTHPDWLRLIYGEEIFKEMSGWENDDSQN